jgi:hypothetical protein
MLSTPESSHASPDSLFDPAESVSSPAMQDVTNLVAPQPIDSPLFNVGAL